MSKFAFSGSSLEWLRARTILIEKLRSNNAMEAVQSLPPDGWDQLPIPPEKPNIITFDKWKLLQEINVQLSPDGTRSWKTPTKRNRQDTPDKLDPSLQIKYDQEIQRMEAKYDQERSMFYKEYAHKQSVINGWRAVRARAFEVLANGLSDTVKQQLSNEFQSGCPYTIWIKLNHMYTATDNRTLSNMYRRFGEVTLKTSIPQVIEDIEQIAGALKENGEGISDNAKLHHLYTALEMSPYREQWMAPIHASQLNNKTWSEVKEYFSMLDNVIEKPTHKSPTIISAEATTRSTVSRKQRHTSNRVPMHSVRQPKRDEMCKYCEKRGHGTLECFKLLKDMAENKTKEQLNAGAAVTLVNAVMTSDSIGLDSCASRHIFNQDLSGLKIYQGNFVDIKAFDGTIVSSNRLGDFGPFKNGIVVSNGSNLLSLGQIISDGHEVQFDNHKNVFHVSADNTKWNFQLTSKGIYESPIHQSNVVCESITNSPRISINQQKIQEFVHLHKKMAHVSDKVLMEMLKHGTLSETHLKHDDIPLIRVMIGPCQGCIQGKITNQPAKTKVDRITLPIGTLIHADIMFMNNEQFLIAVDDTTNFGVVQYLRNKTKDTVLEAMQRILNVFTSHGWVPKEVRTDSEVIFTAIEASLEERGIIHTKSPPDVHEKNIERYIRVVKERSRSLINDLLYKLPTELNKYAVTAAVTALNLNANKKTSPVSPVQMVSGKTPNMNNDHKSYFGQIVFCRRPYPDHSTTKRADLCITLNKEKNSKGSYRVFMVDTKKVVLRSHLVPITPTDQQIQQINNISEEKKDETTNIVNFPTQVESSNDVIEDFLVDDQGNTMYFQDPEIVNMTLTEALRIDEIKASKAVQEEFKQLIDFGVFDPIYSKDIPTSANVIPSLLVMKQKFLPDGKPDKWKARVAAGGHKQVINPWTDISSPTGRTSSFFTMLNIGLVKRMKPHVIDIKGAYLHSNIDEKVYMKFNNDQTQQLLQLKEEYGKYVTAKGELTVQLLKGLYGLKQSAKLWFSTISDFLKSIGFRNTAQDPCVYYKDQGEEMYIYLHVDDLFIWTSSDEQIVEFKARLTERFQNFSYHQGKTLNYLGMVFTFDDYYSKVEISQSGYIQDMLTKFKVSGTKRTLISPVKDNNNPLSHDAKSEFGKKLMSVMYLATRSRPDLLAVCSILAINMSKPTSQDMEHVDHLLKYVNFTRKVNLKFEPENLKLEVCVDASHLLHADGKGHMGFAIILGNNVIYSKSKKLPLITLSSTESELVAAHEAMKFVMFIKELMTQVGIKVDTPVLFEDNLSTINLLKHGSEKIKNKHINVKYFFSKELIESNQIRVQYLPTDEMIADGLTKILTGTKLMKFTSNILNYKGFELKYKSLRGHVGV